MDNYIDNDETQKYGPDLRANLARTFAGADEPTATVVQWVIEGQKRADETMASAMSAARKATSEATDAASEKAPAVIEARKLMTGLHKHLDSKADLEEWSGNIALFFPKGRGGISKYARPLLVAMDVTLKALEADKTVPDHAKFTTRLKKSHKELDALVTASGDATHGARGGLSEQSSEKAAWLREYRSNALLVEGLLVKAGRADEVNAVIPHLSAPGTRKSADPPEPAPVNP